MIKSGQYSNEIEADLVGDIWSARDKHFHSKQSCRKKIGQANFLLRFDRSARVWRTHSWCQGKTRSLSFHLPRTENLGLGVLVQGAPARLSATIRLVPTIAFCSATMAGKCRPTLTSGCQLCSEKQPSIKQVSGQETVGCERLAAFSTGRFHPRSQCTGVRGSTQTATGGVQVAYLGSVHRRKAILDWLRQSNSPTCFPAKLRGKNLNFNDRHSLMVCLVVFVRPWSIGNGRKWDPRSEVGRVCGHQCWTPRRVIGGCWTRKSSALVVLVV